MKKKSEEAQILFKAGLFIIITVALLIFSILWLRYFSVSPDKIITAKFDESGPISNGLPVYYQGVNIGKVSDIGFSKNYRYTLVKLEIYRKDMNLPDNIYAVIDTEGITGQKYVNIVYPDNPTSEVIKDGDTIEGRPSDFAQMQEIISEYVKSGKFERTLGRVDEAVANISRSSKKLDSMLSVLEKMLLTNRTDLRTLVHEAALSSGNIRAISGSVRGLVAMPDLQSSIYNVSNGTKQIGGIAASITKITGDIDKITGNPQFQEGVVKTVYGTGNIVERIHNSTQNPSNDPTGAGNPLTEAGTLFRTANKFVENTDKNTQRFFDEIHNSNVIQNTSCTMQKLGITADKTSCTLDKLSNTQFDGDLKDIIKKTLKDADKTINRYDCIGQSFSDLMGQRFLLMKLLLGKPGGNFQKCNNLQCLEEEYFKATTSSACPVYPYSSK